MVSLLEKWKRFPMVDQGGQIVFFDAKFHKLALFRGSWRKKNVWVFGFFFSIFGFF